MPNSLFAPPKITKRMQRLVSLAKKDFDFWDIACDHGFIGIHALQTKSFHKVVFVDRVTHIIQNLQKRFTNSKFVEADYVYDFYIKDAADLKTNLEGNVVIAGIGGKAICKILLSLYENDYLKATRLVVSPQSQEFITRDFLNEKLGSSYEQVLEETITEARRDRYIFVFDRKLSI